ncbi:MAG: LacI family transcriptional regulator [Xanthobacteraceae bacterium]|nr:LacI family transcriptional regulator [Xanthobacteraceae bacterium]
MHTIARMKRVTSKDVARALGVSQSTVSRAFSADARIPEETRERILKSAQALGYTPNELARGLLKSKSNIVGVVMADMLNPFYPNVLDIMSRRLHAIGKRMLLFSVPNDTDVDEVLPFLLQYNVEGVIITSATLSSKMADVFRNHNTRVVLFNRAVYDRSVSSVCCENHDASGNVARLLIEAGHRRFAIIGGKPDTSTHIERSGGFQRELRRAGLSLQAEEFGGNTYEGGFRTAMLLLEGKNPPDAIFCISDVMAIGALEAARRVLGLRVPDDVSIVGFDDIPSAAWPSYGLTTVRQPVEMMVSQAFSLLSDDVANASAAPVAVRIPGELVVRGSARLDPAGKKTRTVR